MESPCWVPIIPMWPLSTAAPTPHKLYLSNPASVVMFGSTDRRPSGVKKPSSGWSNFYPSRGAVPVGNGTPAKNPTTNPTPTSLVRKKTADELFREHKEASIAWATQRRAQETPVLVPSAPTEEANIPPPVVHSSQQPPPPSLSSSRLPLSNFTSPIVTSSVAASVSFSQPNLQPNPVDQGPFTSNPSSPVYSSSPVPSCTSKIPPKDSVFARFKKEAEATDRSALLSPFSSKYSTAIDGHTEEKTSESACLTVERESSVQNTVAVAKKTFKERMLDLTGVTSLTQIERTLLVGLLVASPVLVYVLESVFFSRLLPASADTAAVLHTAYYKAYSEFSAMRLQDLAVAVSLAVVLSVVFDRNTRATDACLHQAWARLTSYAHNLYTAVRNGAGGFNDTTSEGSDAKAERSVGNETNNSEVVASRNAILARVKSAFSVFARIPLFVRFAVTILILGGVSRVVLGRVIEVVEVTVVEYAPVLLVVAVLLMCAIVAFVSVRYALRCRASHRRVVQTLSAVVKALLQERGRAYPIRYLYEEVAEVVALQSPHNASLTQMLPLFSPVKVTKAALMFDSKGAVQEPVLCGSPLGLSNSNKEHLLQASMQEASFNDSEAHVTASVDSSAKKDVLEGYKLGNVWPSVQQLVESDPRIQRLELIMDGKKQTCWRLLTGSTQANI